MPLPDFYQIRLNYFVYWPLKYFPMKRFLFSSMGCFLDKLFICQVPVMKLLISSAIFICFISSLTTRAQSTGFNLILGENMNYVVDMIRTSSGTFIIAGTTTVKDQVFVTEISVEGEILWSKFFVGNMLWYADILQVSNGNILVPMSRWEAFLLELNQLGDSLDCINITEARSSYFESVIELPGPTLIASEVIFNDDPFFYFPDSANYIKLDSNLNLIDKYPSQLSNIQDLIAFLPNNFYALGEDYYHHSVNSLVIKVSLVGEELSSSSCTSIDPYLNSIIRLNNSSFISTGYCDGGGRSMQAAMSIYNFTDQAWCCNIYPGSYFISATISEFDSIIFALGERNDSCTVYAIDASGNIINSSFIDASLAGNNILLFDDYLYIAGVDYNLEDPRACLVKIPKNSVLAIDENQDYPVLNVYPNPTSDYVIFERKPGVHSSNFFNQESFIQLKDLNGKPVKKLTFNSDKVIWDTRQIKAGVYYYTIKTKSYSETGKLIIIK